MKSNHRMGKNMKYLVLVLLFLGYWTPSSCQEVKTIETPDTTYAFLDPDFELLSAASEGDTNKLRAFLEFGVDVNTSTWEGVTPLMFAAQNGHLRAVEILIESGANLNLKPYNYIDALLGATIAGHVLVVDTLILNGANVNTRNLDGVTPLMYAAAYDHYLLCDVLIFYEASVNAADNFGNTALHFSAFYGNLEITKLLIEKGAEKDAAEINGFTPLMCAAQNGHLEVVDYLIEAGCDIGKTNDSNCDALTLAVINRQSGMADYLLQKGADVNHLITDRINLYELARETGGREMASLVEAYGGKPLHTFLVNRLFINADVNGNNGDLMLGGSMALKEAVHGWEAEFGYRTRPAVRSARYDLNDQTQYQFWEKRSLLYLGAGKGFILASPQAKEFIGVSVSGSAGYTYGSFRGASQKPEDKFVFIPRAGIFYNNKSVNIKLSYEYFNIPDSDISPHRVTLTVGAIFNLVRSGFKIKKEPRL